MKEKLSPNPHIQCGVCSCEYHDPSNHCNLQSIRVDPVPGACSGKSCDESACGRYRCRS